MAEQKDTTKVEDSNLEGEDIDSSDLLSADALDAVIAGDDPDFVKSLEGITVDSAHVVDDGSISLEYTLEEEIKYWKNVKGWRAKAFKVFPFLPRLTFHFNIRKTAVLLSWIKFRTQAAQGLKNTGPAMKKGLKSISGRVKETIGNGLQAFKSFSLVKKLLFVGLVAVTVGGGVLLFKIGTKGLLPPEQELFVGSLTEWAGEKYLYDANAGLESFYESTRTSQNILLMRRFVVNLRRSAESGETPMGAFEFYVEGTVSEVVVEIKDRESEIQDLFLRTIEEATFDQLSTGAGKQLLCDRLRKEVNKVLTKGHVRRIFIKTAIIKP